MRYHFKNGSNIRRKQERKNVKGKVEREHEIGSKGNSLSEDDTTICPNCNATVKENSVNYKNNSFSLTEYSFFIFSIYF